MKSHHRPSPRSSGGRCRNAELAVATPHWHAPTCSIHHVPGVTALASSVRTKADAALLDADGEPPAQLIPISTGCLRRKPHARRHPPNEAAPPPSARSAMHRTTTAAVAASSRAVRRANRSRRVATATAHIVRAAACSRRARLCWNRGPRRPPPRPTPSPQPMQPRRAWIGHYCHSRHRT